MAWQKGTSDRARRLPPEWHRIRARVLRRDNYRCRAEMSTGYRCGEPANQVDHIIPGDDHSEANLQALCQWHHARKSSKEGADARGPRPSQRRQPEAHPGML